MTRSLASRAALAAALLIGFYVLALAVLALLVATPVVLGWTLESFNAWLLKLGFFCAVGAWLIVRSILPRPDRFEPPGPALEPQLQPRLFTELEAVAAAAGQAMPHEVYLIPDVNAWVAQRGGIMGIGARPVMAVGLPLLQALRVDELRAVLAHEFGHYLGGEVKLGPWIYKTREALLRTVVALGSHSGWLTQPFVWYAHLFFRTTHAVSRHQELQADALAARLAGPAALAGGLRTIHAASLAFPPYWFGEVAPALSAGLLPPIASGFARFISQPRLATHVSEALETELREGKQDPYDTHPCLRDRLAALPEHTTPEGAAVLPPAITLLDDVPALEQRLATHLGAGQVSRFAPVAWEGVAGAVHVPEWRRFHKEHRKALAGITPGGLPGLDWAAVGRKVAAAGFQEGDAEQLAESAISVALALALLEHGFEVTSAPPWELALARDSLSINPFDLRERLGAPDAEARWAGFCRDAGITDVDLGSVTGERSLAP